MGLALFDLDNTLIAGDSDHLWGDFLVAEGLVDGESRKATNEAYYRQYQVFSFTAKPRPASIT